jgi:hypothetical protein
MLVPPCSTQLHTVEASGAQASMAFPTTLCTPFTARAVATAPATGREEDGHRAQRGGGTTLTTPINTEGGVLATMGVMGSLRAGVPAFIQGQLASGQAGRSAKKAAAEKWGMTGQGMEFSEETMTGRMKRRDSGTMIKRDGATVTAVRIRVVQWTCGAPSCTAKPFMAFSLSSMHSSPEGRKRGYADLGTCLVSQLVGDWIDFASTF